jgi:hypothetical protein
LNDITSIDEEKGWQIIAAWKTASTMWEKHKSAGRINSALTFFYYAWRSPYLEQCCLNLAVCLELLFTPHSQGDSLIASISLLLPNGFLELVWRLNPRAHENLSGLSLWAVLILSTVSMCCAAAAIGLWRGSRWGHWLAVGLILTNLLGNVTNVVLGTEPRAIVGVPITASLLAYLIVSKKVREFFSKSKS